MNTEEIGSAWYGRGRLWGSIFSAVADVIAGYFPLLGEVIQNHQKKSYQIQRDF